MSTFLYEEGVPEKKLVSLVAFEEIQKSLKNQIHNTNVKFLMAKSKFYNAGHKIVVKQ